MDSLLILAEHRMGSLRDITHELIAMGKSIADQNNFELGIVLFTRDASDLIKEIEHKADKIYLLEDNALENFNSAIYEEILITMLKEMKPALFLMGHTSFGLDLASSLSSKTKFSLVTDVLNLELSGNRLFATRQIYDGKVNSRVSMDASATSLVTLRSGAVKVKEFPPLTAKLEKLSYPVPSDIRQKKFIEYIESAAEEVNITRADILISVGRGIKDAENIELVENLSKACGGVLCCSRPVVDKKWLAKERQVGISGKTVKPKVYISVGISGSFQHLAGMQNSETIIAINKDPKAPIFRVADYGIVGDLFKIVPVFTDKILELKGK
ncbi:MAG: electron transfer flavoprotein subunit alpha/FixB family protein [Thermodesulfobacteriota bacterium]|nr:electron transfer flavoprotein subunit alpha/FixB family protein [Thermodesulfobacteriota bacterium]